jgi:hypothetical protein
MLVGLASGAAVGGATGGLVGALVHTDMSDEDAQTYAEGVRRGGILVSVRADDGEVLAIEQVMMRLNAADIRALGRAYREEGWSPVYGEDGVRRTQDGARGAEGRFV